MSVFGKVPYKNHARRHLPGGSDPLPGFDIAMRRPTRWGTGLFPASLDLGFPIGLGPGLTGVARTLRFRGGYIWQPPEDGPDLVAGSGITVLYPHTGPSFEWIGGRIHVITNCVLDRYWAASPIRSSPFGGSYGDITVPSGTHDNDFVVIAGITNDDSDTITWSSPIGAEQYGWDVAGIGHLGYAFHQFGTFTGAITASYSGTNAAGSFTTWYDGHPGYTVGAVVAENEAGAAIFPGTRDKGIRLELTDDVAAGSTVMIVVATQDFDAPLVDTVPTQGNDNTWDPFTEGLPYIYTDGSGTTSTYIDAPNPKIPMWYGGGQWWEFVGPWTQYNDRSANKDIDGGRAYSDNYYG